MAEICDINGLKGGFFKSIDNRNVNSGFPSYLHLPEHISEGLRGRLHQLSVESAADGQLFGPPEVELSGVLLEEVQSLKAQISP